MSALADAEAEIDVVVGARKGLVEAVHLFEDLAADYQACRRDRRQGLGQERAPDLTRVAPGAVRVGPSRDPRCSEAEDHAGVLDRVVRVVEHRTHGADLGAAGLAHHLLEPARRRRLDVVAEKGEHLAPGVARCQVADRRVVERRVVAQQGHVGLVGQLREVG